MFNAIDSMARVAVLAVSRPGWHHGANRVLDVADVKRVRDDGGSKGVGMPTSVFKNVLATVRSSNLHTGGLTNPNPTPIDTEWGRNGALPGPNPCASFCGFRAPADTPKAGPRGENEVLALALIACVCTTKGVKKTFASTCKHFVLNGLLSQKFICRTHFSRVKHKHFAWAETACACPKCLQSACTVFKGDGNGKAT